MTETAVQNPLPLLDEQPESQTGVWSAQRIKGAIELGLIQSVNAIAAEQIQPASLDLRLGDCAFRVPASFLPGNRSTVQDRVDLLAEEKINIENGAVLRTGSVYLIPLQERIKLRKRVSGIANPKSSTGRLDVFSRLITDYGTGFDTVPERYVGPLWLEVVPRSFDVQVRTGSRLAQIRLKSGSPRSSDAVMKRLNEQENIIQGADIRDRALTLSVDIEGDPVTGIIGYKAKKADDFIDIDKVNYYDPDVFWEKVFRPERGGIILQTDDFHILATKEGVAIPHDYAADMVAYDTLVGEFRVHYAGFFDPGFGYSDRGPGGTTIVLEVRSHEVPFMVEHGQIVGRVEVERLTEPTDKPYGAGIGSSYQSQGLTLGKQFKR
jgi:dCTP deaminase